jgi:hypothetical protein
MKTDWQKKIDFGLKVGRLTIKEIWDLGFQSKDSFGSFIESELASIQIFCADNPGFHVVSRSGDFDVNHVIKGSNAYWLADGDNSPDLRVKWNVEMDEESIEELRTHKGLAEYNALRRAGDLPPFEFYFPKRIVH